MILLCYCKRWFVCNGRYVRVVCVCLYWQKPWVYKSRGLTPRISFFLYFRCILIGQRRLYPTWVSSDPEIKSEELLWDGAGSTLIIRWYSFIIDTLFFGYCNLLLVHLWLKHRGNVFFRLGYGRKDCSPRTMLVSCKDKSNSIFFFKETIKNTGRDKIVKFMVYKTLQSNKSLAK